MKRLRRRDRPLPLLLAGALAVGVIFFCIQLVRNGNDWVGFFGTRFYESGTIYDKTAPGFTTDRPRSMPRTNPPGWPPSTWWGMKTSAPPCARCWPAG